MTDYRDRLKQAIQALEAMQSRVDDLERMRSEPLAIIGMGCRFPGSADHPDAFWRLLRDGVDAITEIPADRWAIEAYYDPDPNAPGKMYVRHGGFIDRLQEFDAHFFGISPQEAETLDPQQRLLLEVSWEALEDAGIAPETLMGSQTGVFIGICSTDYAQLLVKRPKDAIDGYLATGSAHSTASGRISYTFGLKGPSIAVDTACSSSLVALHLACQSLRQQECDAALVGGVNRILTPELTINFSKAQMLAFDGRCKTFDAAADGFIRSEGCGMIVLKRLSDAVAAQDNILAVIRGTAVNQDGRTSGLTVPNGPSQQAVIRKALEHANVDPAHISYIETHGAGTSLGDPIELGALGAVFGKSHTSAAPLRIGSVKTNLGHLEGAASIAGLIKVVLALQNGELPPHLHFHQPTPHIDWQQLPLAVTTTRTPWTAGQGKRLAGVSAFGFSGTNAHAILEEAPPLPDFKERREFPVLLLTISAKTEAALRDLAQRYAERIAQQPDLSPGNFCFTAATGRSHFQYRLAIMGTNLSEFAEGLAAFLAGRDADRIWFGKAGAATFMTPPLPPENADIPRWRDWQRNIAQAYVQGASVDWRQVYHGCAYRRIPLPTYPFQRKRYWFAAPESEQPPTAATNIAIKLESPAPPENAPAAQDAGFRRIFGQQLDMAAQTLTQVVTQQLEFLRQSGIHAAPAPVPSPPPQSASSTPLAERPAHLLAWSAAVADDLESATTALAAQIKQPAQSFAEIAYRLHAGVKDLAHRRMMVVSDRADALNVLEIQDAKRLLTRISAADAPNIVFMFPGLGDHYVNMAKEIYAHEPIFRQWVDRGCALLREEFHFDARRLLYPEAVSESEQSTPSAASGTINLKQMIGRQNSAAAQPFQQPLCSHTTVFLIEYALAQLLISWGIRPHAMIGYSIGEYTAACLSGVFSFDDALRLIAHRARLIEAQPGGVMVAIPLAEAEVLPFLREDVALSAVGSAMQCMIAGTEAAIVQVEQQLQARNLVFRRLQATHPFHTPLLRPIHNEFIAALHTIPLHAPTIPYISNVTGDWITMQQAADPEYWVDHTCQTVRFAAGIQTLLHIPGQILLEVGPGQGLCSFAAQQAKSTAQAVRAIIPLTRTAYAAQSDETLLLTALGRLWLHGGAIDWENFYHQ